MLLMSFSLDARWRRGLTGLQISRWVRPSSACSNKARIPSCRSAGLPQACSCGTNWPCLKRTATQLPASSISRGRKPCFVHQFRHLEDPAPPHLNDPAPVESAGDQGIPWLGLVRFEQVPRESSRNATSRGRSLPGGRRRSPTLSTRHALCSRGGTGH